MAVPPFGSTGMDKSSAGTFSSNGAKLAPSSMTGSLDDDLGATMPEGYLRDGLTKPGDMKERMGEQAAPRVLDAVMAQALLQDASSQAASFFQTNVHRHWQRSYRAVNNEHAEGSIYGKDAYRNRSSLFKPKTRTALRNRLASTTKAMFTTTDVVSIQAEDDSNPQEVVSATLKQEVLNYRLQAISNRNGIPWMMTAIGARYDAEVTGLCASKQTWIYKEKRGKKSGGKDKVLIDRPDIFHISPENIRFDPNANWLNIAQHSSYIFIHYPMTPDDALDMIENNGSTSKIPWREGITFEYLKGRAGSAPTETVGPRGARATGSDSQEVASGNYRNVWLTECFMRYGGVDYCFWAINDTELLSDPVETEELYPHLFGERPIAIGTSQIEPHKTYKMSAVESWQPLQQEANDLTNLRLDYEKRIVSPPTLVKRGQMVDLQKVQNKSQNSIIMVNNLEDVQHMEMPEVPGSIFNEQSMINADMDDLSGNFNASSVQTNKDMNETVGGMHLLAEAGNQVSDFDLTIWNETWVTPVMSQLLKLIEFYEDDEKVLELAGERAQLWQKYGVADVTDEMLRNESTVRVNIGVGATSLPMERVKRFDAAWDTAAKALAPFVNSGVVTVIPDAEAIVDDIFQAASFRDGGKRYFKQITSGAAPPQGQNDPKLQIAQMKMQSDQAKTQVQAQKNQGDMLLNAHKLQSDRASQAMAMQNDAADRAAGIQLQQMKAYTDMMKVRAQMQSDHSMQGLAHAHEHNMMAATPFMTALAAHLSPKPPAPVVQAGETPPNTGARGDPSKPMMAPMPSPHLQAQPGMFATLRAPETSSGKSYTGEGGLGPQVR